MRYKVLWLIAIAAILVDGGMTITLIQHDGIGEGNPVVQSVMDEVGEVTGMLLVVLLRLTLIGLLIFMNSMVDKYVWLVPLVMALVTIAPVVWNTYLVIGVML